MFKTIKTFLEKSKKVFYFPKSKEKLFPKAKKNSTFNNKIS